MSQDYSIYAFLESKDFVEFKRLLQWTSINDIRNSKQVGIAKIAEIFERDRKYLAVKAHQDNYASLRDDLVAYLENYSKIFGIWPTQNNYKDNYGGAFSSVIYYIRLIEQKCEVDAVKVKDLEEAVINTFRNLFPNYTTFFIPKEHEFKGL